MRRASGDANDPLRTWAACASCDEFRQGLAALARISHTKKCIGAPNQRKFLCVKDFLKIQERPDDDRL
jgi:hypothetical protein